MDMLVAEDPVDGPAVIQIPEGFTAKIPNDW
jgi:hypothetical protein